MVRLSTFLLVLASAAAPAGASSYSATLASPKVAHLIAPDITWNCGGASCSGATEESRPQVLCESLAKRAGQIESFLADGRAFTPTELERCNNAARIKPQRSAFAR